MVSVALQEHSPPLEIGSGGTLFVWKFSIQAFEKEMRVVRMEVKEELTGRWYSLGRVTGCVSSHDRD